ncbi:MAG: sigma-70 family RNA polymerase sigma factor [Alphaproteobacteria bacterium]|nr:sigma-70 family RNA polymerase sigma factor [Alphaproteobacteria bacterium]MBU0798010.1 sigma-70 family RNA polymerase sigma factor [Alphaproteobacteria bacterium]MBU0888323.1 sigma-70 family RNA polymerase sigma factor [Alphaproteobacteria bacterium]MBU1814201.1 sigma-70 family RNA polymerase sigma factor [Alphaproteobacteria bacterium]
MLKQFADHEAALAACARGDAAALRALYDAESGNMLGLALRLVRRRDVAQDVVQDAFVMIWRNANRFDPARGQARAWMFAILRYRALNALRKSSREVELDEGAAEALPDDAPDALEAVGRMQESAALRRCLEGLDEPRRKPVMLAFLDGLTHGEIAERLKSPLGTIKSRIRLALRDLQECLQS